MIKRRTFIKFLASAVIAKSLLVNALNADEVDHEKPHKIPPGGRGSAKSTSLDIDSGGYEVGDKVRFHMKNGSTLNFVVTEITSSTAIVVFPW